MSAGNDDVNWCRGINAHLILDCPAFCTVASIQNIDLSDNDLGKQGNSVHLVTFLYLTSY